MWVLVLLFHYTGQNVVPFGLYISAWVGVLIGCDIIRNIYKRRKHAAERQKFGKHL
ncbi:hypothetical protein MYO4S_00090 [Serratia phage 4S]|nr:hypothetical protein MYO4S_00090 [Serratia phage 4S]